MTEPKLEPGIYENKGMLFVYKDDGPELKNHPMFNVYVHLPNGETRWVMETSAIISQAKRIDVKERIEKLSKRKQTEKVSKLIEWLKENSNIE